MSNADIAFINGGAIRASLPKGEISYANIFNVMPFDNSIIIITLTGQQIKEALEHSVSQLPEDFSGLLHVSGLTYNYIVTPEGNSVLDIWFHQRPLNLTKTTKLLSRPSCIKAATVLASLNNPLKRRSTKISISSPLISLAIPTTRSTTLRFCLARYAY